MSENRCSVRYDARLRRHPLLPGRHLCHGCQEAVEGVHEGLRVGAAARKPGVPRAALSRVLADVRAGVPPGVALKLEAAGREPADLWVRLQADSDSARERNCIGQWPADSEAAPRDVSPAA
ncbi:MAG: hypothetical protein OXH99_21235 [Bryobacterales bacterium]|nr:hypothetical protein [Bryobacterales bacterium]